MSENTYINNSENPGELARLDHQERIIHEATNLLPASLTQQAFTQVLDIGCGAGKWVLDMAFRYPEADVTGIDISKKLVAYANARAKSQKRINALFSVEDALQPLPYEPGSFDLIHLRFGAGWLLPDVWEALLTSWYSLLEPGGYLVITEGEGMYTSSPALNQWYKRFCEALYKAGRSPSHSPDFIGVAPRLGHLLHTCGFSQIEGEATLLDYSLYKSMENLQWRDNFQMLLYETRPFLLNIGVTTPEELAELTIRALSEMFYPNFYGIGTLFTFYGKKEE